MRVRKVKMINLNEYYVLVDTETRNVIGNIQKLPVNWNNISGLDGLTEEEISDLKWAGHHNIGWIRITSDKIDDYVSSVDNITINRESFKNIVTEHRKKLEEEPIDYKVEFDSIKIKPNIRNLHTLSLMKHRDSVNFKSCNLYYLLEKKQMEEICVIIENKIQELFDWECNLYEKIDSCVDVRDFKKITYDL